MIKTEIYCDKCGNECIGDSFTIYRNSDSRVIGRSDICMSCYNKMILALEKEEE